MQFSIGEDYKLYITANDVNINVVEIDKYFKTRVTKQSMNDRIGFLKNFVISFINGELAKGIEVPI